MARKPKDPIRQYRDGDGELIQLADSIMNLMERDMAELSAYGISAATVTDISNKREALSDYPHDAQLMGRLMVATDEKAQKRDTVETGIRQMATRVMNKYGLHHEHTRRLGVGAISMEADWLLERTGRRVAKVTEELLAELATEGLTPALHAAFKATVTAYDQAIDHQLDAPVQPRCCHPKAHTTEQRPLPSTAARGQQRQGCLLQHQRSQIQPLCADRKTGCKGEGGVRAVLLALA